MQIEELDADGLARDIDGFAALLHACVHGGGNVGFILPFSLDDARAFWRNKIAPGLSSGTAACWPRARAGTWWERFSLASTPCPTSAIAPTSRR
jgi:hypothetical protein